MLLIAKSWSYGLQVAGMTKEKTQWKEFLETISVLQWALTFLLLGKIPLHSAFMNLYIRSCCSCIRSPVYSLWINTDIWANFRMSCSPDMWTHPTSALFCIILMVYLMFTSLWPLSTLYFIWMVLDWETPERGKGNDDIQVSVKTEEPWTYAGLAGYRPCSHWRGDKIRV